MMHPRKWAAGDILIWRFGGTTPEGARTVVDDLGAVADALDLRNWAVGPVGLGHIWWFDLILDRPIDEMEVRLAFGRPPDETW